MPIISKISAQKKPGRYNIFLDGKYAFSASEQTVAKFVLLKGRKLTDEKITEIKHYDDGARATDLAARYLNYQPRTIFEILQYLKKHHISDESANDAVEELKKMGYLDDHKYVQLFIKNDLRVGTDGSRSLQRKLTQKGVDPEISQVELENVADEDWVSVGQRVLKSMAHKVGKLSERELKRKMKTKLLTHGFDSNVSDMIIEAMDLHADEDEQMEALKKQGIKAYKRFRRFDDRKRKSKIRNYLFTHGFSSSEINAFLDGDIIPLDELSEY
ncbi:recombination regulator RecX [Lactobacillus acetotolerans]|uniref:Regulatory protein RecX n=1 Tax=Lactobacillus acetotolerans TaxID=1600 RepID=A0A0D6A4B7_9LACO|nr:recombination regulator RecX [Lactobacillus acetotolerans]KRN41147.1 recombination regulator RecX [Lactobacillus acetotolerans DSM 20749 = JCM 3825]QFG51593.1 recombination regulator RecX [Lactobacillus acetotolerans]BAQ57611.1 recombination regulator RecX [Lactobacillus acetotolerans]GGV13153.1 regulatory protein RecX [Lactobacillus acetotolerans DSM 20749 = JCM 3825]HBQ43665.1 recombination regulator RecX [Lactobacillus acetotolerans]